MNTVFHLIKRNIYIYIRDRSAVFFSLLSMIVVIGLMVLFLGNTNRDNVVYLLEQYGGQRDSTNDLKNATNLIQVWTIAGLLVVNSLTVSLTMIGIMIQDEARNKIESFYVAPIKRSKMAIGYVLAAMSMASIICILTLAISQVFLYFTDSTVFTWEQIIKMIAIIIGNVFVYSSMLFLLAVFVHSLNAWSALGTLLGTLVGFIGAIYIPMGVLPESVQSVLKYLPILHGVSLMRKVCTEIALNNTFVGLPSDVSAEYQRYMGITVEYDNHFASAGFQITFLLLCGIIALILSGILMKKREVADR